MNDVWEMWSLPWHALQRSLAKSFGAETPAGPPAGSGPKDARPLAEQGGSWLVRARRIAPPSRSTYIES
jgi:hypothetical protein